MSDSDKKRAQVEADEIVNGLFSSASKTLFQQDKQADEIEKKLINLQAEFTEARDELLNLKKSSLSLRKVRKSADNL